METRAAQTESGALALALERCRVALPMADNVGRTGDDRDVYRLLDDVAAGVRDLLPESLCHQGCDGCCHYPQAFFNVHADEWQLICDHLLERWPTERLARFLERFGRAVRAVGVSRLKLAQRLLDLPFRLGPLPGTSLEACPFLEAGGCSIYEVRPWKCRAFGWFSYRRALTRKLDVYACDMQAEALATPGPEPRPSLPSATPFHTRLWQLLAPEARSLPLWILRTWPKELQ